MIGLNKYQIRDGAIVEEDELKSDETTSYSYAYNVASVASGVITLNAGPSFVTELTTDRISENDIIKIVGGASQGNYTVDQVIDNISLTVKESIPDSSGEGAANFYYPAGAKIVGFDKSNNEFNNITVQGAIEECTRIDRARYKTAVPYAKVTTISNSGILQLTNTDECTNWLQGSGTDFTIKVPQISSTEANIKFEIWNTTNNVLSVKDYDGNFLFEFDRNSFVTIQLDENLEWRWWQILISSIAAGIINYRVSSSIEFITSSQTDVILTGMSITPAAGTYALWFSSDLVIKSNNRSAIVSVYKDGLQLLDSERTVQGVGSNFKCHTSTLTTLSIDGTQQIDIRVRSGQGGNQLNFYGRSIILIRLGA